MPYREVRVVDYQEVLRRWLAGDGVRSIARGTGLDRKTVRRLIKIAREHGLKPGDPWPDDQAISMFTGSVRRPGPPAQHSASERILLERREQIRQWIEKDELILTKVHELLAREGVVVSYAALHRFARKWCDFGKRTSITVRKLEGRPGEFAEVDFGRLGFVEDLGSSRPRLVYAFIMVMGYSRLSCVVPVFRQDLESVIRCFEEAFRFFQGCPKRVVIDNVKACLDLADPYVPRFNRAFLEYAAFRKFIPDPARPYHAKDKPVVERHVPYVRERFFKGEKFISIDDVARRALVWCRDVAGRRIHGTTRCVPMEVFEAEERAVLTPLEAERFVIPCWDRCQVHPDHHVRFLYALYSVPTQYVGKEVDVRGDGALVRIYHQAQLIKTHAQKPRGGRSTDYDDYPKERAPYAMRYPDYYRKKGQEIGPAVGMFIDKLLEGEFPWCRLRQAQKLLRLAERYGAARVEAACVRALSYEAIDVHRLGHILEQGLEHESSENPQASSPPVQQTLRFLRPAHHFSHQPISPGVTPCKQRLN
ncbi:MAG: mobile element protein [Bacteroidetes bacterium]|nr:mobile element protein [Bacteroidota bacterium]